MTGTITIVQESRFQMTDDEGASHLFSLSPHAAVEPAQLIPLARRQARICVDYADGDNVVAYRADAVYLQADGRKGDA